MPLLVLLHGAGGSGDRQFRRFGSVFDEAGCAVLAPDSRAATWDVIRGQFDRDVDFIDQALDRVFRIVPVDPDRIWIGGFSDGATYALSLGLVNGDLFRALVAFSPGFVAEGEAFRGMPRVFVAHGTKDQVLPIDRTSRRIVPGLRERGYDVTYREFDGRHEVPIEIAREGLAWARR
jgi:predicted esterase